MPTTKTPASVVIDTFGGVRKTARLLGLSPGAVSRWQTRDGGAVPGKHHVALLLAAKSARLKLTPNDLVLGREIRVAA
jgi:DNA-binding transcriptional regulator YdaS (Cro superfamily)